MWNTKWASWNELEHAKANTSPWPPMIDENVGMKLVVIREPGDKRSIKKAVIELAAILANKEYSFVKAFLDGVIEEPAQTKGMRR